MPALLALLPLLGTVLRFVGIAVGIITSLQVVVFAVGALFFKDMFKFFSNLMLSLISYAFSQFDLPDVWADLPGFINSMPAQMLAVCIKVKFFKCLYIIGSAVLVNLSLSSIPIVGRIFR